MSVGSDIWISIVEDELSFDKNVSLLFSAGTDHLLSGIVSTLVGMSLGFMPSKLLEPLKFFVTERTGVCLEIFTINGGN